jgi:hypothetical protein
MTCQGRLVTLRELDNALSILEGVTEYKLVQPSPGDYELHLVSHRRDKKNLEKEATFEFIVIFFSISSGSKSSDAVTPHVERSASASDVFPMPLQEARTILRTEPVEELFIS